MTVGDGAADLGRMRLRSQMLAGAPGDSVESVVRRLLAVQAQNEQGFRLAIRSRSAGLLARDVDRSLNERRLLVTWLNRGTLHLVRAEDYWWMHALTAPRTVASVDRRLRQEGVTASLAERGMHTVVASLESEGPLSRQQIRARLDAEGVPTGGQALIHLLAATSLRGLIVRGPVVDGRHAFVPVADWLGAPPAPVGRHEALGRLVLRYLEGHEPASPHDLAKWAGITLGDARTGFDQLTEGLRPVEGGSVRRTTDRGNVPPVPTRLLGAFDPLLHGWASRATFVGDHRGVVTQNGIFHPVGLVEGRVVATWRLISGTVEIHPLEEVGNGAVAELVADADDVHRYLGAGGSPTVVITTGPD
jgi:hypothetical protein